MNQTRRTVRKPAVGPRPYRQGDPLRGLVFLVTLALGLFGQTPSTFAQPPAKPARIGLKLPQSVLIRADQVIQ